MEWTSQRLGIRQTQLFCIARAEFLLRPGTPLPHGTFGWSYAAFLFHSAAQANKQAVHAGIKPYSGPQTIFRPPRPKLPESYPCSRFLPCSFTRAGLSTHYATRTSARKRVTSVRKASAFVARSPTAPDTVSAAVPVLVAERNMPSIFVDTLCAPPAPHSRRYRASPPPVSPPRRQSPMKSPPPD